MRLQVLTRWLSRLQFLKRLTFALLFVFPLVGLVAVPRVSGQSVPQSAYGPYNAIFLPDGLGLIKPLAPPPPLDPRYRSAQPPDPLTAGAAQWTLAFWFHSSEPLTGTMLLAGFGDPEGADARFIAVENGHLGLWLGTALGTAHLLMGDAPLDRSDWHFAAAVSDGERVTLYSDGAHLATWPLMQGTIAAQIQIAPQTQSALALRTLPSPQLSQPALTTHFGGRIAALKIYREPLSADQIKTIFDAPPDFNIPTYEEASPHWGVQVRGQAGMSEPQDPITLPLSKAPFEKPVARALHAADLHAELVGENPWITPWRLEACRRANS